MEKEKLVRLVREAQTGKPEALDALFTEFYNDVYYFAFKTVKNEDLACDITQETFMQIIQSIGDLKEPAAFVTWMKQIAYHQCTRYFSKKKEVLVEEDEDGNTVFDTLADEGAVPSEILEQEEFRQTILAMIDKLTEEQRSAVMLYYFDELTVGQIAQIQGVSEGTVKSRLNYARKAMRKSVEDYEKKTGVKLHSFAFLPLFMLFFGKEVMPEAKAAAVRTTVMASAKATMAGAATTAASGGIVAGIMQLPLVVKIIAAVVILAAVIGVGAWIAKPDPKPSVDGTNQETTEQQQEMLPYESQLLRVYPASHQYRDVFSEYAGSGIEYIRTVDGKIVHFQNPLEDRTYAAFSDVQEHCVAGEMPAYYDSSRVLHIVFYEKAYPCPELKGEVVFVNPSSGGDGQVSLSVISRDADGRLYLSYYDENGQGRFRGFPLLLRDKTTGAIIERIDDAALTGNDKVFRRFAANGTVYEWHGETDGQEGIIYLMVENTGVRSQTLLTNLSSFEMILADSAANQVYIHGQPVVLPQGKTTAQITKAFSAKVAMLLFDDGTVYLYGMQADQPGLVYNDELTQLNQAGRIKQILNLRNTMAFVLDDNLTYLLTVAQ